MKIKELRDILASIPNDGDILLCILDSMGADREREVGSIYWNPRRKAGPALIITEKVDYP